MSSIDGSLEPSPREEKPPPPPMPPLHIDGPRKKLVIGNLDDTVVQVVERCNVLAGVLMGLDAAAVARSDDMSLDPVVVTAVEELVSLCILTLIPEDYPTAERHQHLRASFADDCADLHTTVAAAYKHLSEADLHVPRLSAFTRALKAWVEKIEAAYSPQPKNADKKAPAAQEKPADVHVHDDGHTAEKGRDADEG